MSEDPVVRITPKPSGEGPASAKQKPRGLGRGLDALLGQARREEPLEAPSSSSTAPAPGNALTMLAVAEIEPHSQQPRRHFDETALEELAASIAQRGVIQPVIVRRHAGSYQLVAGERRWRAAQRAQLHEIPALVRDLGDREVLALALIENLQREDLNAIEEARAYQRLAEDEGLTQAEIARMVDKSRSHVANLQRLLLLPEEVISMVEQGSLSMGHARALVGCSEAGAIAREAVKKNLSVRQVEQLARRMTQGSSASPSRRAKKASQDDADISAVQRHLEELLGMPVSIKADADPASGAVTIRYASLDQLDFICQRLTGGEI
jgi:ParB family chromosome partitioning protein